MAYQQAIFADGEIYHIFNRGVEKRTSFINKRDYDRFLQTLDYYRFCNLPGRFSFKNRYKPLSFLNGEVWVEIYAYCLMPTHFHLLIKQKKEGGITKFLSKVTNSYTKYFNTKHNRVGPLFQGSFKAVRVEDNEQLLHLSRYIHLNPLIDYIAKDLKTYPFSSYPQFICLSNGFCQPREILAHFSSPKDYEKFVLDQEEYGRTIKFLERQLLDGNK